MLAVELDAMMARASALSSGHLVLYSDSRIDLASVSRTTFVL